MPNLQPIPPYDPPSSHNDWYAVMTIQLGELVENGVFDWSNQVLDWSEAAYDEAQYNRICQYFIQRFYWREISIEPYLEWAQMLNRKLTYEIMPKFKPLYERVAEGINPLSVENDYYKERKIASAYPETLLSGNSDYITDGTDEENERIKEGPLVLSYNDYVENFKGVDEALLDELESMFVSMYSLNMNTGW